MNTKDHKQIISIINSTTTEQHLYLIKCIADKIIINVPTDKTSNCCSIQDPHSNIYLNGIYIEINLKID
jgi:hypothetical protein